MEIRLKREDIDLLDTGKKIIPGTDGNAVFGSLDRDYIEVLIYDLNENFLDSGRVDASDFVYNEPQIETLPNENQRAIGGGVKINTGNVLRKLGYDRGKFIVKYNFLRTLAGSNETILVDEDSNIVPSLTDTGENNFHQMSDGTLMSGPVHTDGSIELSIKENKYFIQEISPTRNEIRLAPQNINDTSYRENFFATQTGKKIQSFPNIGGFIGSDSQKTDLGLSTRYKFIDDGVSIPNELKGGVFQIDNSYVESITDLTIKSDSGVDTQSEVVGEEIIPRFIITNISTGQYKSGDRNLSAIHNYFKDFLPTDTPSRTGIEYMDRSQGMRGIKKIDGAFNPVVVNTAQSAGINTIVTFRSISTKPDVTMKYTWEIGGYDVKGDGSYATIQGKDVAVLNSNDPLGISGEDLTEIQVELKSQGARYSVGLTIDYPAENKTATVYYPCVIKEPRGKL